MRFSIGGQYHSLRPMITLLLMLFGRGNLIVIYGEKWLRARSKSEHC
jgi:hypothetical protein